MARTPKLDAALAGMVDAAREALLESVPAAQLGEHVGAAADGERLVTHRFAAVLDGYAGWEWYVSLARVPRGKTATVCELGLLPGDGALLAPDWVPWSERVAPEELAEQAAQEKAEQESAASGDDAGASPAEAQDDAGASSAESSPAAAAR
ncbi:DUF3027 domain-containing protein [Zafaria sp. Z1313]|uniref:DUF3027 domain-containing protein n=1 Tax=unclassified Zafaria TaxID=2828765 RepID=UPI002E77AA4D|nr:DUF3027 domain-containing protein [Zafaria sp. J156]MEE1622260.1 DUF3027 domain-containing protein [Zafaria sp. J156]